MAKRSAKDELLARIDADIAHVHSVANYVGGDGSEALTARIDADKARLEGMRAYVSAAVPVGTADTAPKTRKPRGKNKAKPGLPASDTGE